jgi:hypothetical protein
VHPQVEAEQVIFSGMYTQTLTIPAAMLSMLGAPQRHLLEA